MADQSAFIEDWSSSDGGSDCSAHAGPEGHGGEESGSDSVASDLGASETSGQLSSLSLFSNMVLSVTGSVVVGIGAQMKTGGWIVTPIFMVLGTLIVSEMLWLVSKTIDHIHTTREKPIRAYQEYAQAALGDRGLYVSSVSSTCSLLAMICNGLVMISQNLEVAVPLLGRRWWAILASLETLAFAFVDIGHLLHETAFFGPLVTIAVLVLMFMGVGEAAGELGSFPESCRDAVDMPYTSLYPQGDGTFDIILNLAQIASYTFFAFAVVVTVPTLKGQMAKPKRFVPASVGAFALVASVFIGLMFSYYATFGSLGPENVINGLRTNRPAGWWATSRPWNTGTETWIGQSMAWLITAHLVISDAIYVPCTVIALEGLCPQLFQRSRLAWFALRVGLSLFRLLVATVVTSFVAMTSLTSSLFCVLNNILIPIAAFYSVHGGKATGPARKAIHAAIFAFGLLVVVLGTQGAIQSLVSAAAEAEVGVFPREGISNDCALEFRRANGL